MALLHTLVFVHQHNSRFDLRLYSSSEVVYGWCEDDSMHLEIEGAVLDP